jgi:uncharacterized protein YeaO (DUF488 family)
MKLQKRFIREVRGKEYVKWIINIPPKDVEALGWQDDQELSASLTERGLLISGAEKTPYETFKSKIIELLQGNETGLTWAEIQEKLNFPQVVPNNTWVRRMEREAGLKRRKYGSDTYWYLSEKGKTVFSIGYEGKSIEQFVAILKENNVQQLIDVRELAFSRINGFAKSALKKALNDKGIVYKHFPELGSPSQLRHRLWEERNYDLFFKEYANALARPESQIAFVDLEGLAQVRRTAMMCVERDIERCHRRVIKERLVKDGFKVVEL